MNMGYSFWKTPYAWVLLLLALVIASTPVGAACTTPRDPPVEPRQTGLVRYRDDEQGVTCYRVVGYEGLSCLPDAWLKDGGP